MYEWKVLVVDDSEAIRDSLVDTLERLGVERTNIFQADTHDKAVKTFKDNKPPLIFMDLDLAGTRGDKAAIEILKQEPATKIIVMTGFDRKDPRVRELVSAGAYEVIEKPIRLGRLQELLELIDSEEKGLRRVS